MKLIKTLVVIIAGLILAAATSHAALLSDLLQPGATLQQGDKIFANFTWSGPTGPAGFTITGIGDGTANNLYGIQIGGPLILNTIGSSDWQLGYSVTIAPSYNDYYISDIHQYVNLAGTPGGKAVISEDVRNTPSGAVVAHSEVGKVFALDQVDPPAELFDNLVLGTPLKTVWVTKDILLFALGPNEFISTTIIEQRFSQVPEPTTMIAGALLLLPFGASTLRMLRKNRMA